MSKSDTKTPIIKADKKTAVKKTPVIRENSFETGKFCYWWNDDNKDFKQGFIIMSRLKTVAYAKLRGKIYDNEHLEEFAKLNNKYSLKHKCEYFHYGDTKILCTEFKKIIESDDKHKKIKDKEPSILPDNIKLWDLFLVPKIKFNKNK